VTALENRDIVMRCTVVPRNLEHGTHSPVALMDKLQEVVHRHRDTVVRERVKELL
jgi:hypothetical protein